MIVDAFEYCLTLLDTHISLLLLLLLSAGSIVISIEMETAHVKMLDQMDGMSVKNQMREKEGGRRMSNKISAIQLG